MGDSKGVGAAACCTCLCLGAFFGIFFGLNYPEIRINTEYLPATCHIVGEEIVPYQCCYKTSCSCTQCYFSDHTCSYMLANGVEGPCCDGYECCYRHCSTCTSCTGSGKNRHCSTHSCNCHCASSVYDSQCYVRCNTCYKAEVFVTYRGESGGQHSAVVVDDCSTSYTCATNYLAQFTGNGTHVCWYDPDDFGSVVFQRGYTWWKWMLFAFPALSILAALVFCSYAAIHQTIAKENHLTSTAATVLCWVGVIFPVFFFLPLYEWGKLPSASGREVLLGFIVVFPVIGCCCACVLMTFFGKKPLATGYTSLASAAGVSASPPPPTRRLVAQVAEPAPAFAVPPPAYAVPAPSAPMYGDNGKY